MAQQRNYHCVVQIGYTIFGVGRTPTGAVRDANRYMDRKKSLSELKSGDPRILGSTVLLPCSAAVYDYIRKGGNPAAMWELDQGKVKLRWEI